MERRVGAGAWFAAAGGLALMAPLAFVGVGTVTGVQADASGGVAGVAATLAALLTATAAGCRQSDSGIPPRFANAPSPEEDLRRVTERLEEALADAKPAASTGIWSDRRWSRCSWRPARRCGCGSR